MVDLSGLPLDDPDSVPEDYREGPPDFEYDYEVSGATSPETEFDFREPEKKEPDLPPSPNPSLLKLAEAYLASGNANIVVRDHIPNLLRLLCAKVADRYNRHAKVHWYGPGVPFRYRLHGMLLGSSGFQKGATVDQFFHLIGPFDGKPAIFPTFEFEGGSPESMRGGVTQDRPSDPKLVKPGSLERMDYGFLHVPEFTQIVDLGERYGGTIQSLLAWADTGRMSYETISGRAISYHSGATLVVGLQTARLNEVETAVAGWARRAFYDQFVPPSTDDIDPLATYEKDDPNGRWKAGDLRRLPPVDGSPMMLREFREATKTMVKGFAPTKIDWAPFQKWLSEAYRNQLAVAQDEQMLYSMALGDHIATGGAWTGEIRVEVPKYLHDIFGRLLYNKRLARLNVDRRIANEALDVLGDRYVLGADQWLKELDAVRIVAARLSIPEDTVTSALVIAENRKYIERQKDTVDGVENVKIRLLKR